MTENKDFDSIKFFRSTRDKHAVLLAEMRPDEIIAFFQTNTGTDNVFPELNKESLRRRDSGYPEPPPQTRTCSIPASGSSVVLAFARARSFKQTPVRVASRATR
jgi:hypothetical protein